jgi:peroxiredoxin
MAQWRIRSQTSRKDFAQVITREQQYSKELLKLCTPFPFATRRFCTGEGKNNAIFQHIRDSKEDD